MRLTYNPGNFQNFMDYQQALALIIDQIDQLIGDPEFLSELAGEDESFIDMIPFCGVINKTNKLTKYLPFANSEQKAPAID